MDTTIVSTLVGVLGSFVGASTAIAIGWITQKSQETLKKQELIWAEIDKRELLYGKFIGECSKLIVDAYGHSLENPDMLLSVYALLNCIRLSATQTVLTQAEDIIRWIAKQYSSPNLSLEDMHRLVHSQWDDPLKEFGEACRNELKSIRAGV